MLREAGDRLSHGLLLCNRAECEWLAGDVGAARTAHAHAAETMSESGSGQESELGSAVSRIASILGKRR